MKSLRIIGLTVAGALLLSSGAALAKKPVPISACGTVITEPGTYHVTQDLYCLPNQQGAHVFASDVTVDLKGHTITCDASGDIPVGAVVVGDFFDPTLVFNDVRVKNGTASGCVAGVIFFYTESARVTKMRSIGSLDGGITLFGAIDTIVKNNVLVENNDGIQSFGGIRNRIKGNTLYDNFDDAIVVDDETDLTISCNTSERDAFGIAIGPFSSGIVVRGNLINNAAIAGLTLFGVGTPEEIFAPVPSGNLLRKNIVQGSGVVDLSEIVVNPFTGEAFVPEGAQCQNTWKENQFVTQLGPIDCIGAPVELDDDDVCAVDEDDDSDDDEDDD